MSQNDLVIANQTFPATRADINSALQALGSNNSGSSAPTTTYANMLWYDTGTNTLKMRSEANDAWINVAYLDQSTDAFRILDDTQVVNTSGTQTGLLGDQSTATWQASAGTTESLVSPAKVKACVLANTTPQPTSTGAVGTYAFLGRNNNSGAIYAGSNYSGSSLQYSMVISVNGYNYDTALNIGGSTVSGTWRAMGTSTRSEQAKGTVFLRIS